MLSTHFGLVTASSWLTKFNYKLSLKVLYDSVSVAQLFEHGASNAKVMGLIPVNSQTDKTFTLKPAGEFRLDKSSPQILVTRETGTKWENGRKVSALCTYLYHRPPVDCTVNRASPLVTETMDSFTNLLTALQSQ